MLHAAELNYNTHDNELLAIFEAFKAWRHYLGGSRDPVDMCHALALNHDAVTSLFIPPKPPQTATGNSIPPQPSTT
ncbi:MAG: hypothetical protein NXY57DRAFT_968312 [Lentinula lateritia]|nr:MAG: hypothetical protein NXY57DRAFT_968312 [Lentinula lateritia]